MSQHRPLAELIALIKQALIDAPAAELARAVSDAEDADRLLNQTLAGTTNPTAERAVTSSANGRAHLDTAAEHLEAFIQALSDYLTDLTGHAPDSNRQQERASRSIEDNSSDRSAAARQPVQLPDDVVRFAERLPVRTRRSDATQGFIIAPNGSAIKVRSGQNRDTAADLKPRFRPVAIDHAEGRAARMMRRYQVSEASLVINQDPCSYPNVGCRVALPAMLPRGAVLRVYVKDGDGNVRYFDTYTGTGEAIR